jgi:hypothetical protein
MVDTQLTGLMQIHSLTQMAEFNGITVEVVSTDGDACVCRCVSLESECTNKLIKVNRVDLIDIAFHSVAEIFCAVAM